MSIENRKVLIFGGEKLKHPSYTWFYSAVTGGMLHGHPGDKALIISEDEAQDLRDELYHGLPANPGMWNAKDHDRFSEFAGVKVILDTKPAKGSPPHWFKPYVDLKQGSVEERDIDVRKWCGLPSKKAKKQAVTDD